MTKKTTGDKDIRGELRESAHRIWLAGLGALAVAEEEGGKMFQNLVDRGKDWEEKRKDEAESRWSEGRSRVRGKIDDIEQELEDRIAHAMHRFGVPSRDEIRDLSDRVEELTEKIDKLNETPKAKAKKSRN